jgi:hypothetical protein
LPKSERATADSATVVTSVLLVHRRSPRQRRVAPTTSITVRTGGRTLAEDE